MSEDENIENQQEEQEAKQLEEQYEKTKTMTELELKRQMVLVLVKIEQDLNRIATHLGCRHRDSITPVNNAKNSITSLFPSDIRKHLSFKDEGDSVIIAPLKYLGTDDWKTCMTTVKQAGGVWEGEGKNKYWKIPK